MIRNRKTLLAVAAALALAACGGGGGGSFAPPSTASTTSGTAVDGYLAGMSIFCDSTANGVRDAGEATAITGANGTFTLSAACSAPSVLIGTGGTSSDTGLPFNGQLKASAGSAYVTPLTNLMVDGGLTATQIATALGLTAGTDVSQTDPVTNLDLRKKTLAVQQIIEQVTNTLAGLAENSSPAALQSIYSAVAKSVVTTLRASPSTPLINANGNVSSALVNSVITGSLTEVAAINNPSLAVAKSNLSVYSGTSIAELTSLAIVTQAQTLTQSTDAASVIANATSVQSNATISSAALNYATLLTTAKAGTVDMTNTGNQLNNFVAATTDAGRATAVTAINAAIGTQASASGTAVPADNSRNWAMQTNVLAIANDTIELNGQNYTLQNFATGNGVNLPARVSPLDTVRFVYQIKGTPIPANAQGVTTTRVSLGVELSDTTNSGRKLEFILDQANVTINAGQMSVAIPANARLTAYGRTANGTIANVVLTNIGADDFISVDGTNNQLSFNAGKVLAKLAAPGTTFASLQNISGTFNLKIAISNLSIAGQTPTSVKGLSVNVTGGNQTMTGLGVQGRFTVQ